MQRAVEAYRRIPALAAFLASAFLSLLVALGAAILGGVATAYLYDRGMSKGNDLAVFLIGFHAVGTFIFVIIFTWLWNLYHRASRYTPELALFLCLVATGADTLLFWDRYYSDFVVVGWVVICLFGLLALVLGKRLASSAYLVGLGTAEQKS